MFKESDIKAGLAFIDYTVCLCNVPVIHLLPHIQSYTHIYIR